MKALLSLNESTTAEILADLLQIDPEQAQQIAGQLRLSEILNLVQVLGSSIFGKYIKDSSLLSYGIPLNESNRITLFLLSIEKIYDKY